jgi:hypothetical protein
MGIRRCSMMYRLPASHGENRGSSPLGSANDFKCLPLNCRGRSRAKLQELAVALLHEDFVEHGADVIKKVRLLKPEVYLASVVSLLPKRTEKIESPLVDISDDELEQLQQHLKEIRAKTVERLLELQPDAELPIAQSIDK